MEPQGTTLMWCKGCGAALPSLFANHPYCAWCVKEQTTAGKWTTYKHGQYRHRKRLRHG